MPSYFVVPYVPETCPSGATPHYESADADPERASEFNLGSSDYYQRLLPNVIAGIVFGVLGILGFIFFLTFMCVQCCQARKKRRAEADPASAQFISSSGSVGSFSSKRLSAPEPQLPARRKWWRRPSCGRFWKLMMVLFGLTTTGICIWGAVVSVGESNTVVSDFWDIVDNIETNYVHRAAGDVRNLTRGVDQVIDGLELLSSRASAITSTLTAAGLPANVTSFVNAIVAANATVFAALRSAESQLNQSVGAIAETVEGSVVDLVASYEPPTMSFQEKWRYIPIIVLFVLGAVLGLACAAACWTMRWPKTASFLVAILWLDVTLLMLLGVGLLNGVYVVSGDACLYTETFVLALANRKITNAATREIVNNALRYYFHDPTLAWGDTDAIKKVTGVDVNLILNALQLIKKPLNDAADAIMASPAVAQLLGSQGNDTSALVTMNEGLALSVNSVAGLVNLTYRSSVDPIYHQAKAYICCSLNENAQDLWVAWTVAGCLSFLFALLCTARIVNHTFSIRKRQRFDVMAAAEGARHLELGDLAPTQPPPVNGGLATRPSYEKSGFVEVKL